jgi:hypothetical protein
MSTDKILRKTELVVPLGGEEFTYGDTSERMGVGIAETILLPDFIGVAFYLLSLQDCAVY